MGLRDERRSRVAVSTGRDSREHPRKAERPEMRPHHLTRAMSAERNRLAGLYTRGPVGERISAQPSRSAAGIPIRRLA